MLRTILLTIEYDGAGFFGWQVQNHPLTMSGSPATERVRTIQGELEGALRRLFNEKVRLHSSSRTDRGVHALAQCAHFKTRSTIPLSNIQEALNATLPADIRIKSARVMPHTFHSRFSAKKKTYRYIITMGESFPVFKRNYCWHVPSRLDIGRMKRAGAFLEGRHDFSVFAREASKYADCTRTVHEVSFSVRGSRLSIAITANGFLRQMVRNIVTFLVRVGERQISCADAKKIIAGKLYYLNKPAPGGGLYLVRVYY